MTTSSMSPSCEAAVAQQQLDAGADRRLGELHRAHVVLVESDAGRQHRHPLAVHLGDVADAPDDAAAVVENAGSRKAAMASITPEPHRPTGLRLPIASIVMRPSSTATRSIAPSAARMPQEMWPPSSAGPDGQEADRISPRWIREISVLVPISMTRVVVAAAPMLLRGKQRGHVVAADEAADVRRQVNIGAGADRQIEFARLDVHGVAHRGDERARGRVAAPAARAADDAWRYCRKSPHRRCRRRAAPMEKHRSWASALIAVDGRLAQFRGVLRALGSHGSCG